MKARIGACCTTDTGLFKVLDKEALRRLSQKSTVYKLRRHGHSRSEFPVEGKVYIIDRGRAFLSYIDEHGKKIIFDVLSSGDIFGNLDFNDKNFSSDSFFIEPFGETTICEINSEDFREILKENPEFTLSLLSNIFNRLTSMEHKLGTLAFSDIKVRLIAQLLEISQKYGKEENNEIKVGIRLTHERLAEMIGSARETVSETISYLRKRGIISHDKKKNFILHKDKINSLFS